MILHKLELTGFQISVTYIAVDDSVRWKKEVCSVIKSVVYRVLT